ncbi:carboxypeptidase-like regulatory domain-containing protein [Gemmatimonadota bacterium]
MIGDPLKCAAIKGWFIPIAFFLMPFFFLLPSPSLSGQERPDSTLQEKPDTGLITVFGEVVDRNDSRPLQNVIVRVPGLGVHLLSDSAGRFRMDGIRPGEYRMVLTRIGYEEEEGVFTVMRPGSFRIPLTPVHLPSDAGPGRVVGRVLAEESGEPLSAATLSVLGTGLTTATNWRGWFELPEVPAGYRVMRVEYLGRQTREDSVFVVEDRLLELVVHLPVEPIALEGFTVTAHPRWLAGSGFFRRRSRARSYEGRQWTGEELRELDPVFLQDVLTTVPGVRSLGNEGMYGRRRCKLSVFVDDFQMEDWFDLDMIEPRNVEALEVYHGVGKPGEFFWHCGVVLVWLKH